MMKNILFILCTIVAGLSACNNTVSETAAGTAPSAEKQLKDAIALHPDSLILKENLIQYFRDNSNFGEAISETDRAIEKDSLNARLWDIKASLFILNRDTLKAVKALEKAVSIDPQPAYKISLGLTYAQLKNKKALEIADALLSDPHAKAEKQGMFIKGFYYSYMADYPKSIAFFDNCLAIDYTYIDAYKEKAISLYNLNKFEAAIQALKKAVALQTTYDEGYYWLGQCYQKLNMPAEAAANYKTALQIDPDYAEAKDALSKLK